VRQNLDRFWFEQTILGPYSIGSRLLNVLCTGWRYFFQAVGG
jgi:hypothetical protein